MCVDLRQAVLDREGVSVGDILQARLKSPSTADFLSLRALMDWGEVTEAQAATSIKRSLAFATIYDGEKLVSMGRVIGDGVLFFYLQDIVVHPDYQRRGLGSSVMHELEKYLAKAAASGSTVALLSARGREGFYLRFGYRLRDGQALGLGLCKFID